MSTEFYRKQNLTFTDFPRTQFEGAFIGNGTFGASLYHGEDNALIIKTGHNEVFDIRPELDTEYESEPMFISCRIPIGYFKINTSSKAISCREELDIYTAEFSGDITTENGGYSCRIISDKNSDVIVVKIIYTGEKPELEYVVQKAMSPRQAHMIAIDDYRRLSKNYPEPREPRSLSDGEISTHFQPYFSHGGYAVSYKITESGENEILALISCAESETGAEAIEKSKAIILNAEKDLCALVENHRKVWADFHSKSFLSINDDKFLKFYYLQMYKLNCAVKADGVPFDTCSVWLYEKTAWPDAWWNLNVELSYSPLYVSNHLDVAHSLTASLKKNMDSLRMNVPEKYRCDSMAIGRATDKKIRGVVLEPSETTPDNKGEMGNLTWALYYCWQEYQMTLDESILSEVVYPALTGAMNFYAHFLYPDENGRLHLPRTASPEYLGLKGPDTNYDMSLMNWGFATLIEVCNILGKKENVEKWQNILDNLADYPHDDKEGFYISSETKYEVSHRHYSHLLAFYPLRACKDMKLLETSLEYWQSKKESLLGYSQTGAASMRALLGDGNKALIHLENLFSGFITPNSMYNEGGNPVIETPLSAATSMQDMLIQSHDGVVDVFPAVPDRWTDIRFENFRAWGGFLINAERKGGKTQYITVTNLCGKKCVLRADVKLDYPQNADGLYEIDSAKGESITLKAE